MFSKNLHKEGKDDNLIILSSYPPRGEMHSHGFGGISSFTKNTVNVLKKSKGIIVYAEIIDKRKEYVEDGVLVKRIWKKNKFTSYINLLSTLYGEKKYSNKLLVEFEFKTYGNEAFSFMFPLFLLCTRLLGYKTSTVLHQIVDDLSELSQHLGLKSPIKIFIKNFLTRIFYKLIVTVNSKIIVLDEIHKVKLCKIKHNKKTHVIPHGVENISGNFKMKNNNEFTMMLFGYIAWYKGTDWIIKEFSKYTVRNPELDMRLVIAGGASPTQSSKSQYMQYYNDCIKACKSNPKIIFTGFVQEKDISLYFQTSDLIIFPYRVLMSSSGPLSLAIAHEKPFLISNTLLPYTETADFKTILKEMNIRPTKLAFDLNNNSLLIKINELIVDKNNLVKLTTISKQLKKKRVWNNIASQYLLALEN